MRKFLLLLLTVFTFDFSLSARETCLFDEEVSRGYGCRLENSKFINANDEFVIEGFHITDRFDSDVVNFEVVNSNLNFVPLQIFDKFSELKTISFTSTGIKELDQPWRNCVRLTSIILKKNEIQTIPGGIFEACGNVETFIASHCSIQEIDVMAFRGLKNLRSLDIQFNLLSSLHQDTFNQVPNLVSLLIVNSNLERIHPRTFAALKNVVTINLSGNRLKSIETGTFTDLPNLGLLYLDQNKKLSELNPSAFKVLPKLEVLSISEGNLTRLQTDSFSTLPGIKRIDLKTNFIEKIETSFLDNFPNIQNFDVRGNKCVDKDISMTDKKKVSESLAECFGLEDEDNYRRGVYRPRPPIGGGGGSGGNNSNKVIVSRNSILIMIITYFLTVAFMIC